MLFYCSSFNSFSLTLCTFKHRKGICTYLSSYLPRLHNKLDYVCLSRNLYRVFFFNWCSPISVPKRKPAKQPITAFLSIRIYRNSTSDWLAGSFIFGAEIGEHQLKKNTLYIFRNCTHWSSLRDSARGLHSKARLEKVTLYIIAKDGGIAPLEVCGRAYGNRGFS